VVTTLPRLEHLVLVENGGSICSIAHGMSPGAEAVADGVLYFSRLIGKASQSQLSRLVSLPSTRA
jgi:hypothetical protein